ncbi:MAG: LysR substrate-binding domain-containing protein [Pseudomonadota bacterium]
MIGAAYFAAAPKPVTPASLADHRLIGWDRNPQYIFLAQWMHDLLGGSTPSLSFDSLQSRLLAVRDGHGIAILPSYTGKSFELVQVLQEHTYLQDIWLMRHQDMADTEYSKAICSVIEKKLLRDADLLISSNGT